VIGKTNNKDEVYFKICNAVLKLEVNKGHLKWTLSDVSKESEVTRSLIYYYFGKEKKVILEEAYRYMLEVLYNNRPESEHLGIKERMRLVLRALKEMPYCFVLFFLEKDRDTSIGEIIRKHEKLLFQRLKQDFPQMSDREILGIYLMELGAIAYKDVNEEDIEFLFNIQKLPGTEFKPAND
jgi:AcrR family transcriptional regulator